MYIWDDWNGKSWFFIRHAIQSAKWSVSKESVLAWQQQVKFNATGFDSDLQKELFVLRDSL